MARETDDFSVHGDMQEQSLLGLEPEGGRSGVSLQVSPFSIPSRTQFLERVSYLTQFVEGVVLVLAEEGVGKSTLSADLSRVLAHECETSFIHAGQLIDSRQVFAEIAQTLELPFESSPGQQLATIRAHIQDPDSDRLNVIIDDAHLLDDQVLSSLLSLFQGRDQFTVKPLSLTLFGLPELVSRIDNFQLVDVRVNDLELMPLGDEELAGYLLHKCELTLEAGRVPPSDKLLERIARQARGVPGLADRLFSEWVSDGVSDDSLVVAGEPGNEVKPRGLGWHIVLLSVLVTLLVVSYLYRDVLFEVDEPGQVLPLDLQLEQPSESVSRQSATAQEVTRDQDVPPPPSNLLSAAGEQELPTAGQDLVPAVEAEVSSPVVDLAVGVPDQAADVSLERAGLDETVSPVVAAGLAALTSDEQQLLAAPETAYTLQVLGVSSRSAAESFRQKQPNSRSLMLFEGRRQGKPWFVLVVGEFGDKTAARKGLETLPASQVKAGAWPRSYLSIQMEIKAVRGI